MATQIYHSSFGRYTLYRESVRADGYECQNCGQQPITKTGTVRLYRYAYQNDGAPGRPMDNAQDKLFCSVDCMRVYYSIVETP